MIIQFFETGGNILSQSKQKPLYSNISSVSNNAPAPLFPTGHFFEIRIKGQLSDLWADWFEGFTIQNLEDGEMLLSGYSVDQSALMGTLNKLVRLNLTIISLNEVKK